MDNLAPEFIDIYWTFIANSNYTLPNLEHDSARLFWLTIGMSVSHSLCPWPLWAGGEFYLILSQVLNCHGVKFSCCQIALVPNCPGAKLSEVKLSWFQIVW